MTEKALSSGAAKLEQRKLVGQRKRIFVQDVKWEGLKHRTGAEGEHRVGQDKSCREIVLEKEHRLACAVDKGSGCTQI